MQRADGRYQRVPECVEASSDKLTLAHTNNQQPARNHGQSTTLDSLIIEITHLCHSRSINQTSYTASQSLPEHDGSPWSLLPGSPADQPSD